jgi:hypothetical protein
VQRKEARVKAAIEGKLWFERGETVYGKEIALNKNGAEFLLRSILIALEDCESQWS